MKDSSEIFIERIGAIFVVFLFLATLILSYLFGRLIGNDIAKAIVCPADQADPPSYNYPDYPTDSLKLFA